MREQRNVFQILIQYHPRLYGLRKYTRKNTDDTNSQFHKTASLPRSKVHSETVGVTCGQNQILSTKFKTLRADCQVAALEDG